MRLTAQEVIARRAALALRPGAVVSLGNGLPEAAGSVAGEEGMLDRVALTVEPGHIDQAFLDMTEVDQRGNVSLGRLGTKAIDIARSAESVYFLGTFTSGGQDAYICDGAIEIRREGRHRRFVERLQHLTFNGAHAAALGQEVFYVTERGVFRLTERGLELIEIAPGVQLERHILSAMAFEPFIAPKLRLMDARIFRPEPMGLGAAA
jgi:propionate CoA-transferase